MKKQGGLLIHWLLKDLLILIAAYLIFAAGMYIFQRKMIYHPYDSALNIQDVSIKGIELVVTENPHGQELTSWYIPPQDKRGDVIVWFHGNAINYKDSLPLVFPYVQAGYGILFAEYPGFSGNSGSPTEEGIYQNSRAFIDWLLKENIPEENIIFYGQSIGSGAAIQMASEYTNIKALVLEAPFTSLIDVVPRSFFFLPVNLLLKDRFDNNQKIKNIKTPTLFVAGELDMIIPPQHSEKLFTLSPSVKKKNVLIKGAGHNDLYQHDIATMVIETLSNEFKGK